VADIKDQLTQDHARIDDTLLARRYFAKFDRITGHLGRVAAELENEGRLTRTEARVLGRYLTALAATFRALSYKYLMTGRAETAPKMVMDRHESGFPVAQELMVMALDAAQASKHLNGMASETELKDRMVREMLRELTVPTQLQFALSQRLYFEAMARGGLFWARNDPDAQWIADVGGRRHFLVHWAVYDSQANLPVVYLMDLHDSGRKPLPTDDRRWPLMQTHLMAQSLGGLKLLTIAQGFDTDFADLHPKRLRRITLGPMYSHAFTLQSGPISDVLAGARAREGQDWALVWTVEELVVDREDTLSTGWFSQQPQQVFKLDAFRPDSGATRTERMVILPEAPYQTLAELDPVGLRDVRKFVVGAGGRIVPVR
jgi:hypothetical protein